jgi:hypothetical protein
MLGGVEITARARAHAVEMLTSAAADKQPLRVCRAARARPASLRPGGVAGNRCADSGRTAPANVP